MRARGLSLYRKLSSRSGGKLGDSLTDTQTDTKTNRQTRRRLRQAPAQGLSGGASDSGRNRKCQRAGQSTWDPGFPLGFAEPPPPFVLPFSAEAAVGRRQDGWARDQTDGPTSREVS